MSSYGKYGKWKPSLYTSSYTSDQGIEEKLERVNERLEALEEIWLKIDEEDLAYLLLKYK